jgi:phenylalanyl-tRNA synthetase alpha chain
MIQKINALLVEIGQKLNELKTLAQEKINALKEQLENQSITNDAIDLTRTLYPYHVGTRHPLSIGKKEICDIFARLGFSIAEGPEIEDDRHVFSSLNFADDHPARDMQDSFFVQHDADLLLRTHTSAVQTRVMKKRNRLSESFVPMGFIATKPFLTAPIVSFIR